MKKKIQSKHTALAIIGFVLSVVFLVISAILTENKIIDSTDAVVYVSVSAILVLVSVFCIAKNDYNCGVYVCRHCSHTFKPTFKAYLFGAHTITRRYLKCPKCGDKTWCIRKRVK